MVGAPLRWNDMRLLWCGVVWYGIWYVISYGTVWNGVCCVVRCDHRSCLFFVATCPFHLLKRPVKNCVVSACCNLTRDSEKQAFRWIMLRSIRRAERF